VAEDLLDLFVSERVRRWALVLGPAEARERVVPYEAFATRMLHDPTQTSVDDRPRRSHRHPYERVPLHRCDVIGRELAQWDRAQEREDMETKRAPQTSHRHAGRTPWAGTR